ncbi:MAG: undecaprenyl-diphosphate phosphatase [Spirochaetales bacterium]|nr:undecaprenyl-diphosphate phosphatase [Spirochaetales bacterium]
MELLKVIFISVIQGIAEFLPISSSGHILLFKRILGLDFDISFDLTIHFGTLLAVILVYRNDIAELVKGLFCKEIESKTFGRTLKRSEVAHIYLVFIIATIPAGCAGLLLKDVIDSCFVIDNSKIFFLLALFFIYTALILTLSSRIKKKKTTLIDKMSIKQALIVGFFQAIAVLPGVSRSGSTISGGLFCGVDKKDAGRFSFLLSIPLILAAFLLEVKDFISGDLTLAPDKALCYIAGLIVSFAVGYISLKLLLKMIQNGKIGFFSLYLIIPAAVSIALGFVTP